MYSSQKYFLNVYTCPLCKIDSDMICFIYNSKLMQSPNCLYCSDVIEDLNHTLMDCYRLKNIFQLVNTLACYIVN